MPNYTIIFLCLCEGINAYIFYQHRLKLLPTLLKLDTYPPLQLNHVYLLSYWLLPWFMMSISAHISALIISKDRDHCDTTGVLHVSVFLRNLIQLLSSFPLSK